MQLSSCSADVITNETGSFCISKSLADVFDRQIVFVTDIEISLLGSNGKRADGQTFNYAVRISLEYGSVHECTRVALVAVAGYVLREVVISQSGAPFASGREAGAAASSETRCVDLVDYFFRSHAKSLLQSFITA